MAYLPKHYVKTGLFANPGNFIYRGTGQEYAGPYYEIATGQYFSGAGPQDKTTQELIPYGDSESPAGTEYQQVSVAFNLDVPTYVDTKPLNELQNNPGFDYQVFQPKIVDEYTKIKKFGASYYNNRKLPYGVTPIPDENDYSVGEYRRYFCKKTNEVSYLELDENQYIAITQKDPRFFWEQYFGFSIPWSITGDQQQVYRTNLNIVRRRMQNLQLPNFDKYLREDYLKFYK